MRKAYLLLSLVLVVSSLAAYNSRYYSQNLEVWLMVGILAVIGLLVLACTRAYRRFRHNRRGSTAVGVQRWQAKPKSHIELLERVRERKRRTGSTLTAEQILRHQDEDRP